MGRGVFIVLEGIDGAGTTTQATILEQRVRRCRPDVPVLVTAEPTSGPIGSLIRDMLRAEPRTPHSGVPLDRRALALLFAADRLHHVAEQIAPAVEAGGVVICDRYVWSSLAYQSLDAPPEWVAEVNRFAPPPDRTILLEVPAEVACARLQASRQVREIFETLETLRRVAANYRALASSAASAAIAVVDGTCDPDTVAGRVFSVVEPLLS